MNTVIETPESFSAKFKPKQGITLEQVVEVLNQLEIRFYGEEGRAKFEQLSPGTKDSFEVQEG